MTSLTAFDPPTSIGLLTHEKAHIPVDFSLCLVDDIFIPALKSKVMVMGELEQRDEVSFWKERLPKSTRRKKQ